MTPPSWETLNERRKVARLARNINERLPADNYLELDAYVRALAERALSVLARLELWDCEDCGNALDEEEMDLEENFAPCEACGPTRDVLEALRAALPEEK